MVNIKDVANYFLTKTDGESGDIMTHLKLQKLVYYAQGWHLAIYGEPFFNSDFEAWAHGPVNPDLFQEYRIYGWDPILSPDDFDDSVFSSDEKELLDDVWNLYGRYGAKYLERLTHKEEPWREARGNIPEGAYCSTQISEDTMREYYLGLLHNGEEE